jgi:hypothetical protein
MAGRKCENEGKQTLLAGKVRELNGSRHAKISTSRMWEEILEPVW